MIKSQLGTVKLTQPYYEMANHLGMKPSEVDIIVETGLRADLTAILNAFVVRYGLNKALDIWYDAVAVYAESQKGE